MNLITDTLRGLVQRKLWPVALLLVAALVAVPLMLAKDPESTVAPAPHAAKEEGLPATFVSVAEDGEVTERRRVLGAKKDPFEPVPLSKKLKAARKKAAEAAKAATEKADKTENEKPASASTPKSGGAAPGGAGTTTGAEPPVSDAPAPKKTYPLYSIKVRFGKTDGELKTKTIERLKVLPSAAEPLLVYRGVEEGGKVAVFELTGSVVAQGDGKCEPTPEDCQILKLRAGETEFLTVSDTGADTDAQYQLELETIHTKTTTSHELAKASTAAKSMKGLKRSSRRAKL